ncbi:hypothetical protein V8D89_006252 [Ganoderma adspersum]
MLKGNVPRALLLTFHRLKTIKTLVALGVQKWSAALLERLASKLESVTISVDSPILLPFDVLSALKPFSNTLQILRINSEKYLRVALLLIDGGTCHFPRVRTLGIMCRDAVPALLADSQFARAFPRITHLELIPTDPPATPHRSQPSDTLDRIIPRREYYRAQRSQGQDGVSPALSSLVECSGDLFAVYAVAFDHTLQTLRLWQHVEADDFQAFRGVLEDTRTRHLCLTTALADVPRVFATLRTLQPAHVPPRVDLNVTLAWSF